MDPGGGGVGGVGGVLGGLPSTNWAPALDDSSWSDNATYMTVDNGSASDTILKLPHRVHFKLRAQGAVSILIIKCAFVILGEPFYSPWSLIQYLHF